MLRAAIATGLIVVGLVTTAAATVASTDRSIARREVRCVLGSLPTATAVTISPDGRAVAYAEGRTIEVRPLNGRSAREVAGVGPTTVEQISWSPDMEYVAVQQRGGVYADDLLVFSVRSRTPVYVASAGLAGWTPDSQLFLARPDPWQSLAFVIVDPRTSREIRVRAFGFLSPDGRRVAFGGSDGPVVETIDGSDRRVIAVRRPPNLRIAWSPDGTRLAWDVYRAAEVVVVGADGSDERLAPPWPVGADAGVASGPFWTPAGIYFTVWSGYDLAAVVADPRTGRVGSLTALSPTSGLVSSIASVSGDGELVVYAVQTRTPDRRTLGYRLVDRTTHADRQLFPCRGTSGRDLIRGSRLPDTILASSGDDVVDVRGGAADIVSCGPGRDSVMADRFDRVGRDCERRG